MTGLGRYDGFRGNRWIENRIKIFKQFIVPSLINQTKKEFIVWMSWRPEEEKNEIVVRFVKELNRLRGMTFVHTFNGLCFYDDKYEHLIARTRLMLSLRDSLTQLESYVKDAEWVMMTIQPSDDMYLSFAVKDIQNTYLEPKAIGYTKGYMLNMNNLEMAEYNPTTIPPFFTIIFKKDDFIDHVKHFKFTGAYESHEYIRDKMKFEELKERGFVVGTHGENTSTTWNVPFKGRVLKNGEKNAIMIQTGIWGVKQLELKKQPHLYIRWILNKLPRSKVKHWIYKHLPEFLQ